MLEQQRFLAAYRTATLELLTGRRPFLLSRRLRLRNLVISLVRRALGFFSATKVDGRDLFFYLARIARLHDDVSLNHLRAAPR